MTETMRGRLRRHMIEWWNAYPVGLSKADEQAAYRFLVDVTANHSAPRIPAPPTQGEGK